jgi:hypothetical protein
MQCQSRGRRQPRNVETATIRLTEQQLDLLDRLKKDVTIWVRLLGDHDERLQTVRRSASAPPGLGPGPIPRKGTDTNP